MSMSQLNLTGVEQRSLWAHCTILHTIHSTVNLIIFYKSYWKTALHSGSILDYIRVQFQTGLLEKEESVCDTKETNWIWKSRQFSALINSFLSFFFFDKFWLLAQHKHAWQEHPYLPFSWLPGWRFLPDNRCTKNKPQVWWHQCLY